MSTTTTLGTQQRTTNASNPFAPGAIVAGKPLVRWNVEPNARQPFTHIDRPLRWRKPRHVDVRLDLFHERLSDEDIAAVFGVMAACPQHTFQVLTKRPERARKWFAEWIESQAPEGWRIARTWARKWFAEWIESQAPEGWRIARTWEASQCWRATTEVLPDLRWPSGVPDAIWPLPNVWLGVSVEDQATADERIPLLLQCPAAVRFASYEPALGAVDFGRIDWKYGPNEHVFPPGQLRFIDALSGFVDNGRATRLDWLIVGGESGPGARPFDLAWARAVVEQCKAAGVPAFVKQLGAWPRESDVEYIEGHAVDVRSRDIRLRDRKGGDASEWPEDLRVREFPTEGAS